MRAFTLVVLVAAALFGASIAADAQPAPRDINGTWHSEFGDVHIAVAPDHSVSGYWNQQHGRGQITKGTYDGFIVLVFEYYQPWNKANGAARFRLVHNAQAGRWELQGDWNETKGDGTNAHGAWLLWRK